jgi:hypothetical protein
VALVCWSGTVWGADWTLKTVSDQPPKEVGDGIKKLLQAKAVELFSGDKIAYRFWFCSSIPLKNAPGSPAKGLSSLDEKTLLGVVEVGEGRRDYKDNEIPPGTYTMRFGLQPQDGDHLGTSEYPFFAVLIPAKTDVEPGSIKTYKAMVKASGKASATNHPLVLSLRPSGPDLSDTPTLTTPTPDHKAIQLKTSAQIPDASSASNLSFQLVCSGRYKS